MKNLLIILLLFSFQHAVSQGFIGNQRVTYAVVVGISDYQDENIPDLQYAHKDALAFAEFLKSPGGGSLDEDHLKVLINEKATQAQFAAALDWLWEKTREDDKAIIYFSGHGDVEKKSLTQTGFLLCWDAPSKIYMAGGAFPLSMLQEVISTISVQNKGKVIMIADACRAGKLSGSKVGGAQLTNANLAKQYENEIKILSCQANEYSIEGKQWGGGRGVFSYHLLDGLYGMADRNGDMAVNLMELRAYLEDKVLTEVDPHSQIPMAIGKGQEKLTFVQPDLLEQIKSGADDHMPIFAATESRGIEEDVLELADTNIVQLYYAFKKALDDKQFLYAESGRTENDYADYYYNILCKEPQLERLHSSMRRNYAAALQDDAQQTMNYWMTTGSQETKNNNRSVKKASNLTSREHSKRVSIFPNYLERACELLGASHYMYKTLQARKYFFKGYIIANVDMHPNQEQGEEALSAFRQAINLQPEFPMAYLEMAKTFGWKLLQPDSVEYYLQKTIQSHPDWTRPYVEIAYIFGQRFDMIEKERVYLEKGLQIDSTDREVWNSWGAYNIREGNIKEAEHAFLKALRFDSTYLKPLQNLGTIYGMTGRYDEAEKTFKKLIRLDSRAVEQYANLGLVYQLTGKNNEAEIYFKKAIEVDSTHLLPYQGLARLFTNTNRFEEADQILNKALQLDSTLTVLYGLSAELQQKNQQFEEAESNFRKVIKLSPNWYDGYLQYGIFLKNQKRFEEADSMLIKAIELNSNSWQAYYLSGICLGYLDKYEDSAIQINKAIELLPEYDELHAELGHSYMQDPNRFKDARNALDMSLKLNPKSTVARVYLAELALKTNDVDQAWQYLEEALELGFQNYEELQSDSDFGEIRDTDRWNALMLQYFPEKVKGD